MRQTDLQQRQAQIVDALQELRCVVAMSCDDVPCVDRVTELCQKACRLVPGNWWAGLDKKAMKCLKKQIKKPLPIDHEKAVLTLDVLMLHTIDTLQTLSHKREFEAASLLLPCLEGYLEDAEGTVPDAIPRCYTRKDFIKLCLAIESSCVLIGTYRMQRQQLNRRKEQLQKALSSLTSPSSQNEVVAHAARIVAELKAIDERIDFELKRNKELRDTRQAMIEAELKKEKERDLALPTRLGEEALQRVTKQLEGFHDASPK